MDQAFQSAAYGGAGWSPRTKSLRQEIGRLWGNCGLDSEWATLKAVLLHRPGAEFDAITDPNAAQMLAPLDLERAQRQHDDLAHAYRDANVVVHYVEPDQEPSPNLMFVADLMFMTPEGAVVARPASTVRAGEERFVARRLADLGIPILRSVRGQGTFEGADAIWIDARAAFVATGLRTNQEGAAQVAASLQELGVETVHVGLPYGSMHLMGELRFVDRDLALAWPGRVPYAAVAALRQRGCTVHTIPDEQEARQGSALNFVTLGPRRILMPAGNPLTQAFYERLGITCCVVEIDELRQAAGGIACMSAVLEREMVGAGGEA
ncbi:MAG: amidinotransferase [Anaerolineae bacterium]|nr:amidinotransferase [Anaerolineae bacterium]